MADEVAFEELLEYLRTTRGFDFTGYKRSSLMRRTTKRMQEVQVESYAAYLDYLQANADEFDSLFNTILINVTSFFRDAPTWAHVAEHVIPDVVQRADSGPIRLWCAGCSSGQEPFTVAMLFAEAVGVSELTKRVKIYATDIDEEALVQARHAHYDAKDVAQVPEEYRDRYFERIAGRFGVVKELRRAVIFGRHNLARDAPISRVDLLVCRNTLMYFDASLQTRILEGFHFALRPQGYLCLGKSEVMLSRTNRFEPVDLKRRIFRPLGSGARYDQALAMPGNRRPDPYRAPDGQTLYRAVFDISDLAQVVLDRDGRLSAANHPARNIFGLSSEDIGRPFQDLPLSYKPIELRSRIEEAVREGRPVHVREVTWPGDGGDSFWDVTVAPLSRADNVVGTAILFVDITQYHGLEDELERSRRAVQSAYEELQSTVEELETTNEELQSTNEELETTNEELQSTNEELETMNEELQSTNEELETINDELRMRSSELNQLNFFFESVLFSLQMGVIVTDEQLRVSIWNDGSEDLWGLRSSEVQRQHLLNLDIGLPLEQLREPARRCLSGASQRERLSMSAVNRRGRTIDCNVTIVPLTEQSEVRGVIILIEQSNGGQGA